MTPEIIHWIPNSLIDDFFVAGFIGGFIGFLAYHYTNLNNPNNHIRLFSGMYGAFLSGCVGGLLAVVFDRSIELAILVGLLEQFIYLAVVKSSRSGKFFETLRDIVIRLLTAGKI